MGITDVFKGKKYKKELELLQQQYEEIQSLITPEMQDVLAMQKKIEKLNENIKSLDETIENKIQIVHQKDEDIQKLEQTIKEKRSNIIWLDDEILVQEFGLYTPKFEFASSLDYKEKLASVRAEQKQMIKDKKAVAGNTDWQVNGSAAKGRKMVSDTQKLLLRAFNTECDEVVSKFKYTNFDASLTKIHKSAEAISKLGTIMNISIKPLYLELKVKELRLAFEYQLKKQEEKEAQREARAELREAAKLQKEIEEQRKKIAKEQTHYQTAYEKVLKQLETNPDNQELLEKKKELENALEEIEKAIKDVDYREANQRAGYVYVISNIGAFGENVYKIGMTRRLDPQERVDELGDASVPFKFDVHAMIFSDDAPALENALHKAFENRKLNMVNQRREFFNVTLEEIKEVVKKNFDKTVEFVDVADAEQFRISKKMRESL